MAEKYITEEEKNKILQKSAMVLPDSPSASGMKPAQIKRFFYDYIGDFIDTINSKLAEVDFTEEEKKSFIFESAGTGLKYNEKTGKIEADFTKILQPGDLSALYDSENGIYRFYVGTSELITITMPKVPKLYTVGGGLNLSGDNVLSVDYEDIENNIHIPDATTAGDGLVKTGNELSVDFSKVAKKSEIPTVPGASDGLTYDESGNYAVDYPTVSGKLGISDKLEQSDISVAQDSGNSLKYNVIVKGTTVGTITIPADKYVSTVTYDSANKQIVFTFSKGESVKVNVADLIDTYTAGTGLKLEGNQFSIDEEYLSSNKGTQVTVGGSNVATFNADTKLDNASGSANRYRLYATGSDGNNTMIQYAYESPLNETIVRRNIAGNIIVATPKADNHAATKKYVDDGLAGKLDSISANTPLYIDSSNNIGIEYGFGLYVTGCNNALGVDWSYMSVDSSTFYVDSCNGLQINSYNNLLNIGLYDYNNGTHIYLSSNNLDIYSQYDLYMAASSNVLVGASNNITLEASNSILFLGDKSSYSGCNFPLDCGLWLKDTCGIGMLGNFGGISVLDKKVGIEADSCNSTIVLTHSESPLRQIKITDDGVYVNAENSLIEATSSHILLQYGSSSNTAIEINADGVYIGGVKYGA